MKVLFAGTPLVAVDSLDALVKAGFDVAGAITRPPARKGRSSKLVDSPVAEYAKAAGLPLFETSRPSEPESLAWIRSLDADLGVVVAYGALLRPDVLNLPKLGWVNLHFSRLPDLRGAAPVQRALLRGDEVVGTTVFYLDEGVDTGPILSTQEVSVLPLETSGELLDRLAHIGAEQLVQTVMQIDAGSATAVPQEHKADLEVASKLGREDGFVSFGDSAERTLNRIRAVSPAPGAWTLDPNGKPLKVAQASFSEQILPAGSLRLDGQQLLVGTGTQAIVLGKVAPAGKTWMNAADWLRGARVGEDARLGTKVEG